MRELNFIDRNGTLTKLDSFESITQLLSCGSEYCPDCGVHIPESGAFARYCPLMVTVIRLLDGEGKAPAVYMDDRPAPFGCEDFKMGTCRIMGRAQEIALDLALVPGKWIWTAEGGNRFMPE